MHTTVNSAVFCFFSSHFNVWKLQTYW